MLGGRRCAYKPRIVGQDAHDAGAPRHELAEEVGEHGFKADGNSHFGILYVGERQKVNRLPVRECLKLDKVWEGAGKRHIFPERHEVHLGIAAKFFACRGEEKNTVVELPISFADGRTGEEMDLMLMEHPEQPLSVRFRPPG